MSKSQDFSIEFALIGICLFFYLSANPVYIIPLVSLLIIAIAFKFRKNLFLTLKNLSTKKHGFIRLGRDKALYENGQTLNNSSRIQRTFKTTHQIAFGTPGTGKTWGILQPQILNDIKENRPLFIIDPKGDKSLRDQVYTYACNSNRADDFFYISLTDASISHTYNPLAHGNTTELRDKIISSTDWSHTHYQKLAQAKILEILLKRKIKTFKDIEPLIPKDNDFTGLRADIMDLNLSTISPLINDKNAPSIFDLYKNNKIVFISLDVNGLPLTSKSFGKIFLSDLKTLTNTIQTHIEPSERRDCTLYVDEFVSFINGTNDFIDLLNKARSAKLKIAMATQSVADLKKIDNSTLSQIIDSTTTKITLRMSDNDSCSYVGGLFSTVKTTKETHQTKNKLLSNKTGMGSEREVDSYIVHPNMIKRLPDLEAYICVSSPFSVFHTKLKPLALSESEIIKYTPEHVKKQMGNTPKELKIVPIEL